MVVEQIVELDEDLMMRYLEGETVEPDELRKAAARRDRPGEARPGRSASAPARTMASASCSI